MEIVSYKRGEQNRALERIRSRSLQMKTELVARVAEIVEGVRAGGDEALIHYTREFDSASLKPDELRVDPDFIRSTASRAEPRTVEAFRQAIQNVRAFHEHQRESGWQIRLEDEVTVGQRILPIQSAGLYVPGGRAAYPSSVVMNVVPAQVAGVPRIVIATPPGTLERAPVVAAVIAELGVDEVYRIGGAQAIAALAFGTETIPRVDKIVGPGNIYVAIAKKLVYGAVGIDSIAGPTEVVVLADEGANPRFIAADLLAQAEHDEEASPICITTSLELAREVEREVRRQLTTLERREIAQASVEAYGTVFVVESIEAGCELVNLMAPEHLELMTENNERAAEMIENAGAIFFGAWSSEPVGDYFAGPNHVLPTLGTARFSSPLGVYDFLKRQSVIQYSREAIEKNVDTIAAMADADVKVDTGMTRLGVAPDELGGLLDAIDPSHTTVEGVYTHLACADDPDSAMTKTQLVAFARAADVVRRRFPSSMVHAAASAGALAFPEAALDMVRIGIAMYGVPPAAHLTHPPLRPVMTLATRVIRARRVPAGTPVSYGAAYRSKFDTTIATVPLGYGDGYPRSLSGAGHMILGGRRVPVAGRVCMDFTMLDVGDTAVREGDEAIVIGPGLSASEVAAAAGTISYELLCRVGRRVPRLYMRTGRVVATAAAGGAPLAVEDSDGARVS